METSVFLVMKWLKFGLSLYLRLLRSEYIYYVERYTNHIPTNQYQE